MRIQTILIEYLSFQCRKQKSTITFNILEKKTKQKQTPIHSASKTTTIKQKTGGKNHKGRETLGIIIKKKPSGLATSCAPAVKINV